jgi:transposase
LLVEGKQFIIGTNRHQSYFGTLEDQVSADNAVRLIDAFIDKLDLLKLGFTHCVLKNEGGSPYAPQVLLKLYLYGYLNKIPPSFEGLPTCALPLLIFKITPPGPIMLKL